MEMKLGPLGDYNAKEKWEETGRDTISHIFVTFDEKRIKSIQFVYVENGALVFSKKHGSSAVDDNTRIVRLNHETEFVTGISGEKWTSTFGSYHSYLSSLTFHTNERKHLAFQAELDSERGRPDLSHLTKKKFHSGIHDRREFGGFFGSSRANELESIGLCIKPILSGIHTIKKANV